MAQTFDLLARLKADVSNFESGMKQSSNSLKDFGATVSESTKKSTGMLESFVGGVGKIAGAIGITQAVSAGFSAITNSVGDAISRVDTLNQFPKVLEQMGYGADEADASIKRLSDGIQGLPTRLNDIASQTQRMTTILGDVDLATETTLALNNAFLASGASSADASRGLEQYTQMLSSGKVDMQSWRTLQETMPYALQETAEAFGYAGEAAQNDLYEALKSGDITMQEFNDKLIELSNETGGFAEVALEASGGIQTSWQNIQTAIATGVANSISAFDDWLNSAGFGGISGVLDNIKTKVQQMFEVVSESLPIILDYFSGLFQSVGESAVFRALKDDVSELVNTLKSLDLGEFIDKWGPLIAGVSGAAGAFKLLSSAIPIITMVFSAIQTWGGLILSITSLKDAVALLGLAFPLLTNPIFWVAAAIGALIAIGVLLWQNWDVIRDKAMEIWGSISDFFTTTIPNIVTGIIEWFQQLPERISETWDNLITGVVEWVQSMWAQALEFGALFIETILQFFNDLPENIGFALGYVVTKVVMWVVEMVQLAIEVGSNFIENVITFFSELPGKVQTWLTNTISNVSKWAKDMWAKAKEAGSQFIQNVISFIQQLPGKVQTWLTNTISRLTTWASQMRTKGSEAARNLVSAVVDGVKSLPGRMLEFGKNVVQGFWNGIQALGGWLRSKVTGFFNGIVKGVKSALDIGSPSKLFYQFGVWVDEGFANGIDSGAKQVNKSMHDMLQGAVGMAEDLHLSPSLAMSAPNIDGELATSNRQINGSIDHNLQTRNNTYYFNLSMGRHDYELMTDDITEIQGRKQSISTRRR